MRQNDPGAAVNRRVGNDLAQRKICARFVTFVLSQVKAARFIIDMRDEQLFTVRIDIPEAAGKEQFCGRQSLDLERYFSWPMLHCAILSARQRRS